MAIRKKVELIPALKAEDYKDGEEVVANATIKEVRDVKTKFDTEENDASTVLTFEDEADGETKSVFLNAKSTNNLIDSFGADDSAWAGKMIKIGCEKDPHYKKRMLVVSPLN